MPAFETTAIQRQEVRTAVPIPLSGLPPGASARLVEARVDADTRDLLRALGLTDASRLRVCKHGDPFIIQVRETRLGLSRSVAHGILVMPDGAEPPDELHGS